MGTFDVQVDASRATLRLEEMSPEVRDALIVAVTLAAGELEGSARSKASGDLLQVRTGKFVKSIKAGVRTSGNRITGRVYSKDPRAGLFEYGGTTPPHEIAPKNAQALLMQVRGGSVFAARVQHPGGKYQARHIIHSAFDEMKTDIVANMEQAVEGASASASE